MAARRKLAADAWGSLLQVHASVVPALDQVVRQTNGMPLSWYDVLLELAAAPHGRLRMGDLAERVVLSRTRVSRLVDDMVARGWIAKQGDPEDRRSAYAEITRPGLAEFKAAAPNYLRAIEREFAAPLTNEELEQLKVLLDKVNPRQQPEG